jgi:uncharacterized membrane protein
MPHDSTRMSRLTAIAATVTVMAITGTAGFLFSAYPGLTPLLPVHFVRGGLPDRWVAKSWSVVFMPVFIQVGLAAIFGAVVAVLIWKAHGTGGAHAPDDGLAHPAARRHADDQRMRATAEAVALLALVWVAFQALAAFRLVRLWEWGAGGLGTTYAAGLVVAIVLSIVITMRGMAAVRLAPVHVAGDGPHWRLKVLYCNPADPALFVPTRSGDGYTLNFGRRAAIVLLGAIILAGVLIPVIIVRFLTR